MGFFSHFRVKPKLKRRRKMGLVENYTASHDGIKTVKVNSCCDFTSNPDLCINVITWNMNGKVSDKDLEELVGRNLSFDLLVVGLQEAPRNKILQKLQSALDESHM